MLLMIKFIFLVRHRPGPSSRSSLDLASRKLSHNCIQSIRRSHPSPQRAKLAGSIVESSESFNDAEWEKFVDFPVLYGLLLARRAPSRRFFGNFMLINVLHRCLSDTPRTKQESTRGDENFVSTSFPISISKLWQTLN